LPQAFAKSLWQNILYIVAGFLVKLFYKKVVVKFFYKKVVVKLFYKKVVVKLFYKKSYCAVIILSGLIIDRVRTIP